MAGVPRNMGVTTMAVMGALRVVRDVRVVVTDYFPSGLLGGTL